MGQWYRLTKKLPEREDVKRIETVTVKNKVIRNGVSFKTTVPFSSYFQRFVSQIIAFQRLFAFPCLVHMSF